MLITDECGTGPYRAVVLIEDADLDSAPALLFANLNEAPREGLVFGYRNVNVELLQRTPVNPESVGTEWAWTARMVGQ